MSIRGNRDEKWIDKIMPRGEHAMEVEKLQYRGGKRESNY